MDPIIWYRSPVFVGVVVTIVMQLLSLFGAADIFPQEQVQAFIEGLLNIVSLGAAGYALWKRKRSDIQPVALTKSGAEKLGSTDAKSPWLIGLCALLIAIVAVSVAGCAGTRAAYKAAKESPVEKVTVRLAQVTTEHYDSLLAQASDLAERGLPRNLLDPLKAAEVKATPIMIEVTRLAEAWQKAPLAETEVELQAALDDAARALSGLFDAIQAARKVRAPIGQREEGAPIEPVGLLAWEGAR